MIIGKSLNVAWSRFSLFESKFAVVSVVCCSCGQLFPPCFCHLMSMVTAPHVSLWPATPREWTLGMQEAGLAVL
jgi:hypothetical protein